MNTTTVLEKQKVTTPDHPKMSGQHVAASLLNSTAGNKRRSEPLLREALGKTLRDMRMNATMTLRDLARVSRVSPGYLSELERGRKEVSSELLASICQALNANVSHVIIEAASMMAFDAAAAELTESMTMKQAAR